MAECAGAILAGGKSSRMGQDKAGLRLYGKTLLQHMQSILSEAGMQNLYVSHPQSIPDDMPGHGPLSGIHAILKQVLKHHTHILFVPVDMPGLTSSLIKRLVEAPCAAPLVHYASYNMPFRLIAQRQWFELAGRLLQKKSDVSLGTFQEHIAGSLVIESTGLDQHAFRNVNTPEQWDDFAKGGRL